MTGEPVSTALLLASAASTGVGLYASGKQKKLDRAINAAETEHARLAGAQTALTASQDFRTALSSQLAIASLRGGSGGSLAQTFGSKSIANFLSDQRSLESQQKFLGIRSDIKNAEIKNQRLARDVSSVGSLLSSYSGAINLNKK